MPASTSTTARDVVRCFVPKRATVACSALTGLYPALRFRPTRHAAASPRDRRGGRHDPTCGLGARSAWLPHLGHTRHTPGPQSRALLRHRVAHSADLHGSGVLAQCASLRSGSLLLHRTVLPAARRRWAPVWPRRAASGHERLVDAVSGSRDRQRHPALRARVDTRPVPIFVELTRPDTLRQVYTLEAARRTSPRLAVSPVLADEAPGETPWREPTIS